MTNRFDINNSQLYDFLDDIEDLPRHIVMFYEEPEQARMVAFRFIKNGLERGDHCAYEIPLEDEDHKDGDRIANNDLARAKAFIAQYGDEWPSHWLRERGCQAEAQWWKQWRDHHAHTNGKEASNATNTLAWVWDRGDRIAAE